MAIRLLLTTIFSLISLSSFAQVGKLFDVTNQLSSNFTNQVYLDDIGFIWTATRNGLNRYDGYQFRIYKKEQEKERGMASNYINCIIQDQKGLFYVGMWGVLQTFDGNSFRTVEVKSLEGNHIDCYVTCFLRCKNGDIYAGTSGFGLLKIDNAAHAHQIGGALSGVHTISQLMEDAKGNIWAVTRDQGLYCINGNKSQVYLKESPMSTYLQKVCEGSDGTIYLGTSKAGVFQLKGNEFVRMEELGQKPVSELYFSRKGTLLIGYDGEGLAIYDPKTGQLKDNPFYSMEVNLSKSKVTSITEDRNGNVWLGLLQKGIYMQPGDPLGFHYMGYKLGPRNQIGSACVLSTFFDRSGRLWVGTDRDGVYVLRQEGREGGISLVKHFKENFPATVMAMEEDALGRIWIGTYNEGGGWIDPELKSYHKYNFPLPSNLSIFGIKADASNRLWMGTMGHGLLMLNQNKDELKVFQVKNHAEDNRKVNSITNNFISQISLSKDEKQLFLATTMGICCYDIEKDSWVSTFGSNCLNYGSPVRVANVFDDILWIGTNDGLSRYDLTNKKFLQLNVEKEMSGIGIASIEKDKQDRFWMAADNGLYCYDAKTKLIQSYYADDGLQSNEFSDNASCQSGDGILCFAGVGGINWFTPEKISESKWEATVQLTGFKINGMQVSSLTESGGNHVTDTAVIASRNFELDYSDNSFAIQLSTLTYDTPEHVVYLYSINGEKFAQMQQGTNEITFSHMPPGTYRFSVKAVKNNIETPERTFTVVIHAPWYRSSWAISFYLTLFGLILWYFITNRRRKEKDRLRLQEHIHAEEMGEAKLRFFMNISHEIRTPMTLIVTPLLSLVKNESDPHKKAVYETIKRNAERILHLINQMMDLRKIDKGQMMMRMMETDFVSFVNDVYTLFTHQAKVKDIHFTFDHDSDTLPVWLDRQNFDKVIMNLLSNAFKYTPTGGEINIRLTHDNERATLAISDNGEKIPEDKLERIFERFYQSASTVNERNVGTGIGLDLTRALVELHHGTIKAHNLEQGCEFVVTIPLGEAHLKPEEIITETEQEEAPSVIETEDSDEMLSTIEPMESRNKGRYTLVIAEDDDEIREYLAAELGETYDVVSCGNGLEALKEVYRVMPDLVISDVMMPEMDGNTLCSKLKSNPSTNVIPVILLTAKNRDEDKVEGLGTGADAYIVKPFNMDILKHTIVNLLNSHQLLRLKYERNDVLEEKVEDPKLMSPDQKLLERVMATINAHIDDSDLSVDMIADKVGISRVHLHRKMKELTGQTPHDFIRNIRLKRAANLLSSQGANVTEVMYACGFSNSASFSTVFKKFYGLSPREYMKEHSKR